MSSKEEEDRAVDDAVAAIRDVAGEFWPEVMITFGSGLSRAVGSANVYQSLAYARIPGMAVPRAVGHPGKLLLGVWSERRVLIFQGRPHFYEGHCWPRVTLPVRIAARMGAGIGVFTNTSGAIQPRLAPGTLVVIDDHINFVGSNPLLGVTANDPANMFPDLAEAYSPRLRRLLDEAAAAGGVRIEHGVYVAVSGPNYETPAEVRALALLGGDLVGMSTVGEVIVARHAGLECCAVSCVTNMAAGVTCAPIRHHDVLQTAQSAQIQLAGLLDSFLRTI